MLRKSNTKPIYEKKYNAYRVHFYFDKKQYRTSYIDNHYEANTLQQEVNKLIAAVKNHVIFPPEDTPINEFIFLTATNRYYQESPQQQAKNLPDVTLGELMQQYLDILTTSHKSKKSIDTEKLHLRNLQRFLHSKKLGNPQLKDIDLHFFEQYKQFRYQTVRTDTVNREMDTFRLLFQKAVDNNYINENIARKIKRDQSQIPPGRFRPHKEILRLLQDSTYTKEEIEEIKRYRYLLPDEIKKVINLTKGTWLHPLIVTYAVTGMRRSEALDLQWKNIDMQRQFLEVTSRKQSKTHQETLRTIYFDDAFLEVLKLQKQQAGNSRWVFPNESGNKRRADSVGKKFHRIVKGTEFEGIGLHCFRHSVASNLASKGVDQRMIDSILGHQTEAMRRRYRHLFPEDQKQVLGNWNKSFLVSVNDFKEGTN